MVRTIFYIASVVSLVIVALIALDWAPILWLLVVIVPLVLVGIYDIALDRGDRSRVAWS